MHARIEKQICMVKDGQIQKLQQLTRPSTIKFVVQLKEWLFKRFEKPLCFREDFEIYKNICDSPQIPTEQTLILLNGVSHCLSIADPRWFNSAFLKKESVSGFSPASKRFQGWTTSHLCPRKTRLENLDFLK